MRQKPFIRLQKGWNSAMKVERDALPVMNCALERPHSLQQIWEQIILRLH